MRIHRLSMLAGLLASVSVFTVACDSGTQTPDAQTPPASETVAAAPETSAADSAAPAEAEPARDIPESAIWDLTALYESPAAWTAAYEEVSADVETLPRFQGTLGDSAGALLEASDTISMVYKEAVRLLVYATLKADEDTRIAENEERRQLSNNLLTSLGEAVSWYDPELLAVGEDTVMGYLAEEPGLEKHRFNIENTLRAAPYTLDAKAEAIMAASGVLQGGAQRAYNILANADIPWPEITLAGDETIRLSQSGYTKARQAPDRDDRQAVFDAFWGKWKEYENTLGTVMNNEIQSRIFVTEQRGYESSLERALFGTNMPVEVYRTLIDEVNAALPTLHRYFTLRKRMLGIEDDLRYFDIYPPLVALDKEYTLETSIEITRDALEPLGDEFIEAYNRGIEGRWMHVYPQPGKRSGAYMFGAAYDVHPYVLLNHNDDYESASTFAHEYGHAVHSVLSNANQPWETAGYATQIAETASIMLEMLLQDHVISQAQSPEEKLYYLGIGLESLRGTFFRQTMFAEFELKMNEMVEDGQVLTGAKLTEIYLDLLKRYHGHDEGVMAIDDLYAIEWAYIPHFYRDFYVFQYATSMAAAAQLATEIGAGNIETRDAYIDLLKAGGSDYPYNLMKATGVDLASPAPYRALVERMNATMDEMEALLDEIEAGDEAEEAPAE